MAYAVELLFPAQQEPPRHRGSQDEVHNHLIRPELPPVASLAKAASPQLYSAGVDAVLVPRMFVVNAEGWRSLLHGFWTAGERALRELKSPVIDEPYI